MIDVTVGSNAKDVAEVYAANVTMTPNLMTAGKGAAANFSPAPEAVSSLSQIPPDPTTSTFFLMPDAALAFFLGGALVIFVLLCYEAYLWKQR